MQVSYGAIERPLILVASGALDFGQAPSFDVTVGARQIDLDRTLGGGAEQPVTMEAAVAALVDALPRPEAAVRSPANCILRRRASWSAAASSKASGSISRPPSMAGSSTIFTATLPGETHLDLTGALAAAPSPTFRGHARLDSERPSGFAAWWRGEVGSAINIGRFTVDAALDLTTNNLKLADLVVTTGAGTVSGSVNANRLPPSDEFLASVDLSAGRADLVEMRAIVELLSSRTVAIDQVQQMTMSLHADVLTAGGVEARDVAISGTLDKRSARSFRPVRRRSRRRSHQRQRRYSRPIRSAFRPHRSVGSGDRFPRRGGFPRELRTRKAALHST